MTQRSYVRDGRAPIPEKEATSRVMSANKSGNTKPELQLRKALWRAGIKGYRLHWKKVPGRPDIVFVNKKTAIFVNGCFWHRCPYCEPHAPKSNQDFWNKKFDANIERDQKKIEMLKEQGWQILVIWECQIKKRLQEQVKKIGKALSLPS